LTMPIQYLKRIGDMYLYAMHEYEYRGYGVFYQFKF
jgi:hypothetical protein